MSTAVAKIAKPNFAFIQQRFLFKHIYIGLGVSALSGFLFKTFYIDEFNRKHEEFYATYNPWEDFERMRNLGLFQSAPPDDVLKAREEKRKLKEKQKKK